MNDSTIMKIGAAFVALGLIGMALLALIEVIGTGTGAQRWIAIGSLRIQPSEVMKIVVVLALARYFHKVQGEDVGKPLYLIVPLLLVAAPALLVLRQPDLGTAMMLLLVGGAVFFAAGVRLWKFVAVGMAARRLVHAGEREAESERLTRPVDERQQLDVLEVGVDEHLGGERALQDVEQDDLVPTVVVEVLEPGRDPALSLDPPGVLTAAAEADDDVGGVEQFDLVDGEVAVGRDEPRLRPVGELPDDHERGEQQEDEDQQHVGQHSHPEIIPLSPVMSTTRGAGRGGAGASGSRGCRPRPGTALPPRR